MKSILVLYLNILAGLALPTAPVDNTVRIVNHCPYDIWFWTVGPEDSNIDCSDDSRTRVPGNHGYFVHDMFNFEDLSAGISLKIRDFPYYQVSPAGIVQVEYTVEANQTIWYDLSVIDCDPDSGPEDPSFCPLIGGGITLRIPGTDAKRCPPASCFHGSCKNAYQQPGPFDTEPSLQCRNGIEIVIETCTERVGPRTFQSIPVPNVPLNVPPAVLEANATKEVNGTEGVDTDGVNTNEEKLQVSPDSRCGRRAGFTCKGSQWGACCAAWGYCGSTDWYCRGGCQHGFGNCSDTG